MHEVVKRLNMNTKSNLFIILVFPKYFHSNNPTGHPEDFSPPQTVQVRDIREVQPISYIEYNSNDEDIEFLLWFLEFQLKPHHQ